MVQKMSNLFFYPKLTDELKNACGLSVDKYVFTYEYQDKYYGLKQKGNNTVKISDPLEIWGIETEGISFSKTVSIAYPHLLYGANGIACKNASIGVCIMWTNKTLTQTGCILPESDVETNTGRICTFNYTFEPGTIKGDLELSVIFFLKEKANNILPGEERLNNEEGVEIGEIETVVLDFNSIYMEFPIEEYNSANEPLWWVYFSEWEDPKVDLFDRENICLYLNPYYSACPMVGEEIKNLDLLIDILATTYLLVFNKISENSDDMKATQQNLGLENNSICSIMYQFIESCKEPLHFESQEALLRSLEINIRKMLGEGDDE